METATYLLLLLGGLGALDIALFHSVSHGIRSHPDSAAELVTHSLRGPTYALLFVAIPNFVLHGAWAYALAVLFLFDFAISVWDFALERQSRGFLGGLPSGEYVLHMIMAMLFGAFVTVVIFSAGHWRNQPTDLIYQPANVPAVLRILLLVMAVLVLYSGLQDAASAWRMWRLPKRGDHPGTLTGS